MAWLVILSPWAALLFLAFWDIHQAEGNGSRTDRIGAAGTLVNLLTLVGAVAGVSIAAYAYHEARRQADASEMQIDVAKDTAKRQLRAYVYVTAGAIEKFAVGEAPSVTVTVQMIGQTPAYLPKEH